MKSINWSININETEFQELFELYWNARENSPQRLYVIEEINKYAYFYLIKRPHTDFDLASDFFLEMIMCTKKFIEEYEPSYHISFLVYYTARIKRRLLNYRCKVMERKKNENVNEFYELNPERHSDSVFESMNQYHKQDIDIRSITEACLSKLCVDEEIAIKLYYGFSLNYKNFRFLVRGNRRNVVFDSYRQYLLYLNSKCTSEKKLRESVFNKLYLVNVKLRDQHDEACHKKREHLLGLLSTSKSAAPLRLIADIFSSNITNVYRKIKRGRKKLEHMLNNQLYLKFNEDDNSFGNHSEIKKAA